jgi:hypothetical protein
MYSKPSSGNYQNMTSAPILPNYLGLPFRILVSPFVHFDPEQRVTDIMMFNSRNLGALIVDEDPHVKSWEDGQYNILNMSIEETYGFGILNEGQAIPGLFVLCQANAYAHAKRGQSACVCWSHSLRRCIGKARMALLLAGDQSQFQ